MISHCKISFSLSAYFNVSILVAFDENKTKPIFLCGSDKKMLVHFKVRYITFGMGLMCDGNDESNIVQLAEINREQTTPHINNHRLQSQKNNQQRSL